MGGELGYECLYLSFVCMIGAKKQSSISVIVAVKIGSESWEG